MTLLPVGEGEVQPFPKIINIFFFHFSCSSELSMKFKALINTEITNIGRHFRFMLPKPIIHPVRE